MTAETTEGALSGLRVLDFSHLLQGPYATQMLGDMGADIIKIERPGAGDLFRSLTFRNAWLGGSESPNFLAWNRNKRSLALNLKAPEAHEIVMELARGADVVIQNFRPGVMARMGYGYADFRAVNARIVYCSGSGYGEAGPYLTRPGQDMLIQGLTGLMAATGQRSAPPTPVGAGFSDQIGAMNMVQGILAALLWRERSGEGQEVKVNLMAGLLAHQNQELVMTLNTGEDFERPDSGIGHPGMDAPFGVYPAADGWVTIAMSPFASLVEVLEAPDLARYDDPAILFEQRDEIWHAIAAETVKWPRAALMKALLGADIWAGEVKTHLETADDPQVRHLGMISSYEHPVAGRVQVAGPAVEMGTTPLSIRCPAPLVGEHTAEILSEIGRSREEVARLLEAGIADGPG